MGIELYAIRIPEDPIDHEIFDILARLVPPQALEKINRYRLPIDRLRSLSSRLAPIWFLNKDDLLPPGVLPTIGTRAKGKPYIETPVLNPRIEYNTSHDGSFLLLGTISSQIEADTDTDNDIGIEIGVDIMHLPSGNTAKDVEQGISDQLTLSERRSLAIPLSDEQRSRVLSTLWTLKEGCVKATGDGIGWGLQRISVDLDSSLNDDESVRIRRVSIDGISADELGWFYLTGGLDQHAWSVWVKGHSAERSLQGLQLQVIEWDDFAKPLIDLSKGSKI